MQYAPYRTIIPLHRADNKDSLISFMTEEGRFTFSPQEGPWRRVWIAVVVLWYCLVCAVYTSLWRVNGR